MNRFASMFCKTDISGKIEDYILKFKKAEPQTWQQQKQMFSMFAKIHNERLRKKNK